MIGIINYGIGNVMSIVNMFRKLDVECMPVSHPSELEACDKLVLPGVGSFDYGMKLLSDSGLISKINEHVIKNKPLLGICLGMQMLGKSSEEGYSKGLGYIDSVSKKFSFDDKSIKVPHMGWNNITYSKKESRLLLNLEEDARYYFVHSYYMVCTNIDDIMLMSDYYGEFVSGVERNNVYGVQFHPEKSHKYGMTILRNFARL